MALLLALRVEEVAVLKALLMVALLVELGVVEWLPYPSLPLAPAAGDGPAGCLLLAMALLLLLLAIRVEEVGLP
jgi:hypothetical protein